MLKLVYLNKAVKKKPPDKRHIRRAIFSELLFCISQAISRSRNPDDGVILHLSGTYVHNF